MNDIKTNMGTAAVVHLSLHSFYNGRLSQNLREETFKQ